MWRAFGVVDGGASGVREGWETSMAPKPRILRLDQVDSRHKQGCTLVVCTGQPVMEIIHSQLLLLLYLLYLPGHLRCRAAPTR